MGASGTGALNTVLLSYKGARPGVVEGAGWPHLLADPSPLNDVGLVTPDEQGVAMGLDHRVHGGTLPEQPPYHVLKLGEGNGTVLQQQITAINTVIQKY